MSDITAVVLSIGEKTTQRALESLRCQTLQPEATLLIENIEPFHKALNLGASKVRTPFFLQVDSDMVLDPNCLEELRKNMFDGLALVDAHLLDPLYGKTQGVKLFRTACFMTVEFRNSLSPDTDFDQEVRRRGWETKTLPQILGKHLPNYTPDYTFSKYLLEGGRYRYRRSLGGLQWAIRSLEKSGHEASIFALIGLSHGLFCPEERDLLRPHGQNQDFDFLESFLSRTGEHEIEPSQLTLVGSFNPARLLERFYKLGMELRIAGSPSGLQNALKILQKSHEEFAWIAKVGLCHGLFSERFCPQQFQADSGLIAPFFGHYRLPVVLRKKLRAQILRVLSILPRPLS